MNVIYNGILVLQIFINLEEMYHLVENVLRQLVNTLVLDRKSVV